MTKRISLALAALSAACVAYGETTFDAGADLRIRQEIMDNVPGLPGGGRLLAAPRSDYRNHMRFRPRVWGEVRLENEDAGMIRLYTRLTDEMRWYVRPKGNAYTWPDEAIVDNLLVEGKDLFDGTFDFAVGRQDIYNLYGLNHLFVDGTPGDGSRTVYADMVRFGLKTGEDSRLDFFALYNEDDNLLRWGTDRGRHRSLSGLSGNEDHDQDDWGYGVIWSSKFAPWLPYKLFAVEKGTRAYRLHGVSHPWTQRGLFGTKLEPQLVTGDALLGDLALQLEAMGQAGGNGDGDTLSGWSTYAGINWKGANVARIARPVGSLGYHFMSGDEDAADENGGHRAWDPMWARGVNDSELFLYGTHYGAAWWSNMHYLKLALGFDFNRRLKLVGSCGPLFAAAQDGLGGGNGSFKGFLSQARLDFPLWWADAEQGERFEIFGHLLAEFFNPGDYYETDRPSWFVRWQIDFKF